MKARGLCNDCFVRGVYKVVWYVLSLDGLRMVGDPSMGVDKERITWFKAAYLGRG
jgi:hypothetical protein